MPTKISKMLLLGLTVCFVCSNFFLIPSFAFAQAPEVPETPEVEKPDTTEFVPDTPLGKQFFILRKNYFNLGPLGEMIGLVTCTKETPNLPGTETPVEVKVCKPPHGIREIVVNVLQSVLGFTSIVALIIVVYGGIVWLTAAGNQEKVDHGKKILIWAIIGLLVLMAAWSIVTFIMATIQSAL